jgi:hypothetical protein
MPETGLSGERGVALPLALMTLGLLVPLMLAFAALSVSEPVIATNLLRASQARALADSGLQYALWALDAPIELGGVPSPLPASPAPAPFDGQTLVPVGLTGGFTVQVAAHASGDPQARRVTAVGWVSASGNGLARAHRQVIADAVAIPHPGRRAPCALCVRGALGLAGNVAVDGTGTDAECGGDGRHGVVSRDATTVTGPVALAGGAGGLAQHQPADAFDAVTLAPAVLDALRDLARSHGTYYGPGFPRGGSVSDGGTRWDGRIVFDASHPLRDGVVFVDTPDGGPAAADAPAVTLGDARLEAGGIAAPDGVFRGWLVVNGALAVAGGARLRGLVYAVDTLTYGGPGAGSIEGLAVALNARGTATRLEPSAGGGLRVTFDCGAVGAAGLVPHGFALVPGSYREERD